MQSQELISFTLNSSIRLLNSFKRYDIYRFQYIFKLSCIFIKLYDESFSQCLIVSCVSIVSKLTGLNITSRTRCLPCRPRNISWCSRENPSSVTLSMRQYIFSTAIDRVTLNISRRSWRWLDWRKSFSLRMNDGHWRVCEFGNCKSSLFWHQINFLMGSRSRRLLVGQFFLNEIDWFRTHGKTIVSLFVFIIFILHIFISTNPGPGTFCNWGTRYELSGNFSRVVPKLFPFSLD